MERFFDYIEKFKVAIFIALIVHIIFFFSSIFTTIRDVQFVKPPEVEITIPLDDIDFDPEIAKILELPQDNAMSEEVSNLATNENDTRDRSYEDYSTNEFESLESELTAKELEAQYFKEAQDNNDRSNVADNMEKHELNKAKSTDKNQNSEGQNAFSGKVMISFSLTGRNADYLANPGYTCKGSGTVVVKIKVDKSGVVRDATVVSEKSVGASNCMMTRAIKYAKKSRFDYKAQGTLQTGTITYNFVSK